MNYQEVIDYLYEKLPMFHRVGSIAYKANLDNIKNLCAHLENPQSKIKTLHIAGTNGKGSSSHFLASIFMEAGYKVGLYTSPHLIDFKERIKINGKNISEESVVKFVEVNKNLFEKIQPSFFEMVTAMAFYEFEKNKVDIAIIETGLGGRLDSTNIIDPEMSLITNIGYDHVAILGNTLEKIATEKSGIIKASKPVVISEYQKEIAEIFSEKAKEMDSEIYFASEEIIEESFEIHSSTLKIKFKDYAEMESPLKGLYQIKNLKGVLKSAKIMRTLGWNIDREAVLKGVQNMIKNTNLMGRWQLLSENPKIICDSGHNVDGIKEVLKNLELENYNRLHFVIGMVNDKDIDSVLALLPKDAEYYFTKANIPRALEEAELKNKAGEYNLAGNVYSSVKEAIVAAKENYKWGDLIFIGGSTFVVGEVV